MRTNPDIVLVLHAYCTGAALAPYTVQARRWYCTGTAVLALRWYYTSIALGLRRDCTMLKPVEYDRSTSTIPTQEWPKSLSDDACILFVLCFDLFLPVLEGQTSHRNRNPRRISQGAHQYFPSARVTLNDRPAMSHVSTPCQPNFL